MKNSMVAPIFLIWLRMSNQKRSLMLHLLWVKSASENTVKIMDLPPPKMYIPTHIYFSSKSKHLQAQGHDHLLLAGNSVSTWLTSDLSLWPSLMDLRSSTNHRRLRIRSHPQAPRLSGVTFCTVAWIFIRGIRRSFFFCPDPVHQW